MDRPDDGAAAVVARPGLDVLPVRFLGIDEYRFRTVRWFRDPDLEAGRAPTRLGPARPGVHRDDPTGEFAAAWGVKERLWMLLACSDHESAATARMMLGVAVLAAYMPETTRLWNTINGWWNEIETFIDTASRTKTEAGNTARNRSSGPAGATATTTTAKHVSS